jgi:hypothetical protein
MIREMFCAVDTIENIRVIGLVVSVTALPTFEEVVSLNATTCLEREQVVLRDEHHFSLDPERTISIKIGMFKTTSIKAGQNQTWSHKSSCPT